MLYNSNLSTKHPGKTFQNIEGIINREGTDMTKLANVIAKYRKEMIDVLKSNEATETHDENVLKNLIGELERKKAALETDLGKTPPYKIDLTENTDIIDFWRSIIDGSNPKLKGQPSTTPANPTDITGSGGINEKIQNALNGIQFLHYFLEDDGTTWDQKDHWKLFKGASTEMTNIGKTLKNPLISTVLNEKNGTKVGKDIQDFVKSVKRTKGNAFYIQSQKLYTDEQRETAIRISLYLYCVYKLANDPTKITKELCDDIKEKLDQIINEEIPKIKGLHNTKVELGYLVPEYETLKDLNAKKGDIDLGEKDLGTGGTVTETRNLKTDFENGTAVDLDKYIIKSSEFEVKDSASNPIPVIFSDGMLDFTDLSANKGIRLSSDILLDIGGSRLKIGKIFIDNNTLHQLDIKFDDEATIKAIATAKGITLPSFPLDFSFYLKGTKKVSNGLDGCYASLTKKYTTKLKLGSIVPPTPPSPPSSPSSLTLKEQREWAMTISNVDQVNRAIAEREADEELRERYRNVGWNIFDRANLFLRRKFIKDKIVRKKMKGKEGFDWSDSGQSAAHRHQIEKQEKLADDLNSLVEIDADNYPETRRKLDTLIDDFTGRFSMPPRTRGIDEDDFKDKFEDILKQSGTDFDETDPTGANPDWKKINEIITSNNLRSLSTNIMMQAKQFQAHQKMVYDIREHIITNPGESDDVFDTWCRGEIGNYISTYDDIPDFLQQMGLSIDEENDIKTLKGHEAALANIQAQSLKYRLQILDGGSEAYNVKKEGGRLTKAGRRFDDPTENSKFFKKHPNLKEAVGWIRGGAKIGAMVAPGLLLAPAGPFAVALGVGGMSAVTTLLKKKSHYEKEHRSYQRMQATNLTDYRNKRTNLANEVAGMKKYEGRFWGKKKRIRNQYNDYIRTTQDQLLLTNTLITSIKTYLNKGTFLTGTEKDELGKLLAEGLARLDYHKETGQNFLGSDDPTLAEKEYKKLQNAIIGGMLRLKVTDMEELRTNMPYVAYYNDTKNTIENGTGKEYNNQGYLKAKNRFNRRSRKKAGVGALKAGAISFGLSLLASSLASGTKSTTSTTETSNTMHHGQEGGQYNLGDWQEDLFVSGDVNPAMNSVITPDTQSITGATIYSSVDSVPCSVIKGASELALANSDLTTTFSSSPFSGNTAWIDAKTSFINEARTSIWSIPGVSEGNRQLALARAIEGRNEGILKPAIAAQVGKPASAALIGIDPSAIHWVDGGIKGASTGVIGQSFRNMGIMGLDYVQKGTETVVQHTARAISIPVPSRSNTFGEPKSEVA